MTWESREMPVLGELGTYTAAHLGDLLKTLAPLKMTQRGHGWRSEVLGNKENRITNSVKREEGGRIYSPKNLQYKLPYSLRDGFSPSTKLCSWGPDLNMASSLDFAQSPLSPTVKLCHSALNYWEG